MGAEGFEPRAQFTLNYSITYVYVNMCVLGCVHVSLHEGGDNRERPQDARCDRLMSRDPARVS